MKNTFHLTKMARSMLIAGMVFGITGVVYAQVGAAGTAGGGVGAGIGAVSGGVAGQAGPGSEGIAGQAGPGSEGIGQAGGMSNTSKALRGQGQDSSRSGRSVPGLGSSLEPRAGAAAGPDIPPGKNRTSTAAPRMKEAGSIGGESTSIGVGSSKEQGATGNPSVPRY